jgi:hypothetical protein
MHRSDFAWQMQMMREMMNLSHLKKINVVNLQCWQADGDEPATGKQDQIQALCNI